MEISEMIRSGASIDDIGKAFDGLSLEGRVDGMYALKSAYIKNIYGLAEGRACTLEDSFIPAGKETGRETVFHGKSTLAGASKFKKRITRLETSSGENVIVGHNKISLSFLIGPGYFVGKDETENGVKRVLLDYTLAPPGKLDDWPPIKSNAAGLSRLAYYDMKDWMWKVSETVTVGRAYRLGKWQENYFLLCRED